MKDFFKDETGAYTIVEATFVFPIVFFVLLILIYLGNLLYIQGSMDSIAAEAASYGARYAQDPLYENVKDGGAFPEDAFNHDPYHYIGSLFSGGSSPEQKATTRATELITDLNHGFFYGMAPQGANPTATYTYSVVKNTMEVRIPYRIELPIRWLFGNQTIGWKFESVAVVSASDGRDLIDNVGMLEDWLERKKAGAALAEMAEKISSMLSFGTS